LRGRERPTISGRWITSKLENRISTIADGGQVSIFEFRISGLLKLKLDRWVSRRWPAPRVASRLRAKLVGERFRRNGRMMPDDIVYHASWMDSTGARCFQIVEAPHQELLRAWVNRWEDLIDFEIVPVLTSSDFWSKASAE
jgi:hypothetical protein